MYLPTASFLFSPHCFPDAWVSLSFLLSAKKCQVSLQLWLSSWIPLESFHIGIEHYINANTSVPFCPSMCLNIHVLGVSLNKVDAIEYHRR